VIVSVSVRNVMETRRLESQLVAVDNEFPVLRAQRGYISEFIVHGIGPIPESKTPMHKYKLSVYHVKYNIK